ncbi:zinc finger protein, putative [Plasmodium gallinaceum]|uniref:Zinc finger protein, putative n=1 Tax=Plasmodium gallinaceum TaxID=5849 RepID=A0A1J1GY58_PLAGA|nr:zinc finger protein, putative [Plasmodium gallinaceum]CRG97492.1 zinc finger protein, putative [Plasmodium gallinaceum]
MNDRLSRDLTKIFMDKREIAKEEIDPRKNWLKRILINNNSIDLKNFLKASTFKKKEVNYCINCKGVIKQSYYLNAKKSFCDLCEEVFCMYCVKSIDLMKDTKLKYIKIRLCKNCFIYINELKYIIHPNLSIDKKAIDLENIFNKISSCYTTICGNISQLNGLILLCENNKEFLDDFKKEIKHLTEKIEEDVEFLNRMKKKNNFITDNTLILNKMSKNLFLYLKIIRSKIMPCAVEVLKKSKELL